MMTSKTTIVVAIMVALLGGCCLTGKVARDAKTYTAEVFGNLLRQKAAAKMLFEAAEAAKAAGDVEACQGYARPALVIEAKAQGQAYRSLWLASLPYPLEDGTIPAEGVKQDDPGVTGSPRAMVEVCGE
jgi:hypothetical protein